MSEKKVAERNTVRRWFWVWDFEKEERWLNAMALQGWTLDRVGFCKYEFIRTEAEAYTVRLEMREKDACYTAFMKETGAEYIGRVAKWTYYRKKAELGAFDIFSDIDSRIAHLDRIGKSLLFSGIVIALVIGIGNLSWLHLLLCCLLMYGLGRIHGKKESLKLERELRE